MRFRLLAPADNERGARYMQEALAAVHQSNRVGSAVVLEYGSLDGQVGLSCEIVDEFAPLVAGPLKAKYPNCTLAVVPHAAETDEDRHIETWWADVKLVPDIFPLLRHAQFEDLASGTFEDPIDALLQAISPDEHTLARIEIAVGPTGWRRQRRARNAAAVLDRPAFRHHGKLAGRYARWITHRWLWPMAHVLALRSRPADARFRSQVDTTAGRHHEREDDVQAAREKAGQHLFDVRIRLVVQADPEAEQHARGRFQAMIGALGSFTASRLATFRLSRIRRMQAAVGSGNLGADRRLDARQFRFGRNAFLLSHEELATLFHPPTASVAVEKLHTSAFTELEAPASFNSKEEEGAVILGRVRFRDDNRMVPLGLDARRRHLYLVGRTGVGKSTLLLNMVAADIATGHGAGLIDPHGDLAELVLAAVPPQRTNDVIVFDPSDPTYAVGFNPLACHETAKRDLVADDVVSAFSRIYDLSQTPRLKDTLRNALYVLIEQGETLVSLLMLLSDEGYRERIVNRAEDELARLFWTREFASWNERYRTEALSAIQNKVRPFLMNRSIRAIVGQKSRTLDLRKMMDEGKVLVANLSKGRIGEDNANLLGALLVSTLQQAAMSRADVPEEQRRDFFLTVDEFQNYRTGSFASILSEARKYRLCLTVAHQYLKQLDDETSLRLPQVPCEHAGRGGVHSDRQALGPTVSGAPVRRP